jgi:threonine dehydrogenase-like Zn-dependent dehydrogenase
MAVALHAVRRGEVGRKDVAIVIGCGPVGLGVILMLKATGVRTVVAADFSPGRRTLAERCGADVVVDPAEDSPYEPDQAGDPKWLTGLPEAIELAIDTREKLGRLPVGWWHAWRLAEKAGLAPKRPVIFECVGTPGVIDQIVSSAPLLSRIVVVGVCVGPDTFVPAMAINKEVDLRFVLAYNPTRSSSATPCTCWPRARSIRGR